MDLLASLGLDNTLPEQSTRLLHPGVISALEKCSSSSSSSTNNSSSSSPNNHHHPECQLGFNCCLTCGTSFLQQQQSSTKKDRVYYYCKGCNRVKYCSEICRKVDSEPQEEQAAAADDDGANGNDVDEGGALGHSPVICSLLNLCNEDEIAEDNLYNSTSTSTTNYNNSNNSNNNKKKQQQQQQQKYEASKYRVQTERESYPATLFNMAITDGPTWLIENLTCKLRFREEIRSPDVKKGSSSSGSSSKGSERKRKRRGKRDRQSFTREEIETTTTPTTTTTAGSSSGRNKELVLHIVGASVDSELWGWDGSTTSYTHNEMLNAYAEASTNVVSYLKNFIDTIDSIRLVFVGPECPRTRRRDDGSGSDDDDDDGGDGGEEETIVCRCEMLIPGSKTMLHIETHCCNYGEDHDGQDTTPFPAPDGIIFFNPGFSCTDYDWSKALSAASSYQSSTPFLVTTNTEMEGFADIKCLVDGGYVDSKELPTYILETVVEEEEEAPSSNSNRRHNSHDNDDDDDIDNDEQNKKFFFGENPYAGLRVRQSGTMANDLYVKSRWVMGGLFQSTSGGGVGKKTTKKKMVANSKKRSNESEEGGGSGARKKKRRKGGNNPALI